MTLDTALTFLVMLFTFTWIIWQSEKRADKMLKDLLEARNDAKRYKMLYEMTKEEDI